MPRKPVKDKLPLEAIAQHMTVELQILNQSADHARDMLMSKVNFFLVLTTAIGGGLAYMLTNADLRNYFPPTACVVIFILILMGLNTLRQGLDLSASSVTFYRRAGRVRRWYVDQEPSIKPYLPFETAADNLPRMSSTFINLRGAESILLITNGSLCGIWSAVCFFLADYYFIPPILNTPSQSDVISMIVTGLVVLWLVWILQVKYVRHFMSQWEKRQEQLNLIHFPDKLISDQEFEKILKKTA